MMSDALAGRLEQDPQADAAWLDTALSAADRAKALLAELTLEEKVAQLGSVWLADNVGRMTLDVYGREGRPCRRCGTPIVRERFMNRSSHFCPACQRKR